MNVSFTRRRALVALLVVGLASAAAGAGTMALFSDTEQSTDNTVSAGTLDLTVNGGNQDVNFSDSDVAPGYTHTENITIANAGSVNGTLTVNATHVNDSDGANPEPETSANPNLGENVVIELQSADGSEVASTTGDSLSEGEVFSGHSLDPDETYYFVIHVDTNGAGNELQGDVFEASFEFELNQEGS